MDCSRRRTLKLGLGAVGSVTLLAGCSDEGPSDGEDGAENESGGNESESNESDENETDEQPDHPNEVGDDMEDDAEPTGFAPEANESNDSDDGNGTAGPEQDDD